MNTPTSNTCLHTCLHVLLKIFFISVKILTTYRSKGDPMFLTILYCDSSVLNNLWSEDLGLSNLTPWKKRPNRYSITGSANSWLHSVDLNPNKSLLLVKTVQLIPATKLVPNFLTRLKLNCPVAKLRPGLVTALFYITLLSKIKYNALDWWKLHHIVLAQGYCFLAVSSFI